MTSAAIHYVTANEWFYLELSVSVMASYRWVKHIVVLHTDRTRPSYFGRLARVHPKVREEWRPFGSGWDRQPEAGGFDEIAARNLAVALAASHGADWVVKCDSDEFYAEAFGAELAAAQARGLVAVDVNWNQLVDPRSVRRGSATRQIIAWRAASGIRYRASSRAGMKNRTMHCYPSIESGWYSANGHFYFHARHMVGPKRRSGSGSARQRIPASAVPASYARACRRSAPSRARGGRRHGYKVRVPVSSR